ncbi:hypothetical protein, partial [Pseudomonas syringae group genomosp. 3]|uniref:hypothetical protein n=1 Tax=Pseudomonas syringae group genomosp. 3 TaxID=251701 RepID=UPI001C3F2689
AGNRQQRRVRFIKQNRVNLVQGRLAAHRSRRNLLKLLQPFGQKPNQWVFQDLCITRRGIS